MPDRRSDTYTLELAEEHIADLNGGLFHLNEYHEFADRDAVPNTPGAGASAIYSLAGTLSAIRASGITGGLPLTWADTGTQTVTGTTPGALSATYTIPGNDANVGTVYRLSCWGNGTWGATQQTLAFGIGFPGTTQFGTVQQILNTAFAASAPFRWNAILWLMALTTGGSAAWHGSLNLAISEVPPPNLSPGTAANNTFGAAQGPSTNTTQDSTIANTLNMLAWWGSTTGAPTITCHGTFVERLGF